MFSRDRFRPQNVVKAAGDEKTRKGSRPRKSAFTFILMETRLSETRWRMPPDTASFMFDLGNIHRAIDKDRKS